MKIFKVGDIVETTDENIPNGRKSIFISGKQGVIVNFDNNGLKILQIVKESPEKDWVAILWDEDKSFIDVIPSLCLKKVGNL